MSKAHPTCLVLTLACLTGCVEICATVNGGFDGCIPGEDPGPQADVNPPLPPDDARPATDLRVTLSASRSVPAVNEDVQLTCSLVEGDPTGVTFQFQPQDGRLIVDSGRGTASFIVTSADVGDQPEFTCTATNDQGTSPPSNRVVIQPIG